MPVGGIQKSEKQTWNRINISQLSFDAAGHGNSVRFFSYVSETLLNPSEWHIRCAACSKSLNKTWMS